MGNKIYRELVAEDYILLPGETYKMKLDKMEWGGVNVRLKKLYQNKPLKRIHLFIPFLDISMIRQRIIEIKQLPLVAEDKHAILRILAQKERFTVQYRQDQLQDIETDIQRLKRDYGADVHNAEYIRRLKVLEEYQTNYRNWKLTEHFKNLYIS